MPTPHEQTPADRPAARTAGPRRSPATLPELLRDLEVRRGAADFLHAGEVDLSASGLARGVRAMAAQLHGAGLRRGDRLGILLDASAEQVLAILAAAELGALAVPVNPRLKEAQIAALLAGAAPRLVLLPAARAGLLRDPSATLGEARLVLTDPPDAGGAARLGRHDVLAALPFAEPPPPSAAAGDGAVVLYSSGSTGRPKGVVQTHGNLVRGAEIVTGYLALRPGDHLLGVLPLGFDYGLNQLLGAMWLGAELTLMTPLSAAEVAAETQRRRATVLAGVPTFWRQVTAALDGGLAADRFASLRVITSSGGRLWPEDVALLRRHLPWVFVHSMYGLTEAFRSATLPPAELDRRPTSFGRAIDGVELLVVDPDTGRPVAPGEVGELVHAGALVAPGYWDDPEATARVFRPHPRRPGERAVFTGDLVHADADGFLYYHGRLDRQIKVAGYRIAPEDVEGALRGARGRGAGRGVGAAVVFGVPDRERGERIVAVVEPADERDPPEVAALIAHCRHVLPSYMVPAEVVVAAGLPRTGSGKLDLQALRAAHGGEGR